MKIFKNDLFKRSAVLLIAVLMMLASCMPVFADDDQGLVEWFLSDDYQTLSGNGKEYKEYKEVYYRTFVDSREVYCFENRTPRGEVMASSKDSEIVWIRNNGINYFYATEKGAQIFRRFYLGSNFEFRFEHAGNYYQTSELVTDLAKAIDKEAHSPIVTTKEFNVTYLANAERYHMLAYDETHTFSRIYGAIYRIDGKMYYINYGDQTNDKFDANGNFSFRQGSVDLVLLSDSTAGAIMSALETLEYVSVNYTYESEYEPYLPVEFGIGAFWVGYSFIGFAAPIPFVVIGTVFANSQKRGKKKRWYIISAIALLYLILAIVTAILLAI